MKKLSKKEKHELVGYAEALQSIMATLTGSNSCGKSYDPIAFSEDEIHSYAFDFKNGGRHHPIKDFENVDEIKDIMLNEATEWVKEGYIDRLKEFLNK